MPADLSGPGEVVYKRTPTRLLQSIVAATVAPARPATSSARATSTRRRSPTPSGRRRPWSSTRRPTPDQARFLVANIGAVLILVGIFSFGFTVLTGVVEEKQSRVVEVVLSTVRARDLLMGKVLGIGVLGLVQLAVFMVAAPDRRPGDRAARCCRRRRRSRSSCW